MKTVQFVVKSRSTPTTRPVSCADELYKVASDLLRTEIQSCSPQPLRLRLMGKCWLVHGYFLYAGKHEMIDLVVSFKLMITVKQWYRSVCYFD